MKARNRAACDRDKQKRKYRACKNGARAVDKFRRSGHFKLGRDENYRDRHADDDAELKEGT